MGQPHSSSNSPFIWLMIMSHDCILHSYGAVTLTESVHRQKDISTGKVLKTVSVTGSHYSECPGQHTTHTHTHTHTHTQTHTHPQGENTPTSLSCYHSIWEPWPGIIIVACQQLQTVFHFCWPAPPPPHAVKTLILLDPFNTVDTLLNTQNAECIAMRYSIYLWRWKTNIYVCKI